MASKARRSPTKAPTPKAPTPITVGTKQIRGKTVPVIKGLIHPTLKREIAAGKHAAHFQARRAAIKAKNG